MGSSSRRGRAKTVTKEELMDADLLTDVTLVCMFCGERYMIHVFRDRHLPERIYWECFDCQKGNGGPSLKVQRTGGRKRGASQASAVR
jgi:hypothetical protein